MAEKVMDSLVDRILELESIDKIDCMIKRIQKQPLLLVACEDGWLYMFSIEPLSSGNECTLLVQHRIDGRDVSVDIPPTMTSVTESSSSSSAKTEPVDIEKPLPSTAFNKMFSSPEDTDTDAVAAGRKSRQSYASIVSTRCDSPHDNAGGDVDLPCPDDTGYCTPAEELQADWPKQVENLRLDDDQEFPAVTRLPDAKQILTELELTGVPPYYVDEDYPAGPRIIEPFPE